MLRRRSRPAPSPDEARILDAQSFLVSQPGYSPEAVRALVASNKIVVAAGAAIAPGTFLMRDLSVANKIAFKPVLENSFTALMTSICATFGYLGVNEILIWGKLADGVARDRSGKLSSNGVEVVVASNTERRSSDDVLWRFVRSSDGVPSRAYRTQMAMETMPANFASFAHARFQKIAKCARSAASGGGKFNKEAEELCMRCSCQSNNDRKLEVSIAANEGGGGLTNAQADDNAATFWIEAKFHPIDKLDFLHDPKTSFDVGYGERFAKVKMILDHIDETAKAKSKEKSDAAVETEQGLLYILANGLWGAILPSATRVDAEVKHEVTMELPVKIHLIGKRLAGKSSWIWGVKNATEGKYCRPPVQTLVRPMPPGEKYGGTPSRVRVPLSIGPVTLDLWDNRGDRKNPSISADPLDVQVLVASAEEFVGNLEAPNVRFEKLHNNAPISAMILTHPDFLLDPPLPSALALPQRCELTGKERWDEVKKWCMNFETTVLKDRGVRVVPVELPLLAEDYDENVGDDEFCDPRGPDQAIQDRVHRTCIAALEVVLDSVLAKVVAL